MRGRGLKRKAAEDAAAESEMHLRNFQSATRKRESMRIKNAAATNHPAAMEAHLKGKISLEKKIIEGAAKLLMTCKNRTPTLEAAKTLMIARLRSDMLKFELNKLRRGRGSPTSATQQGKPSHAGISLSDIRIPLLWRRKDHINDMGDPRRYAVFCVARIGSQIYDTTLIEPVDRQGTDITLPDVIVFSKVPNYFEMTLEVYSLCLEATDLRGIASTPQKIARSISRVVGKNLTKQMKDFEKVGPKFDMIASATLGLDSCGDETRTHNLYVEKDPDDYDAGDHWSERKGNGGYGLPLFGQFCCRLAALPYCCEEEVLSGLLFLNEESGKGAQSLWGSLSDWKLNLWTDRKLQDSASPYLVIPINRDTRIEDSRSNTLTVTNKKIPFQFNFEDTENLHKWLVHLIQHAADHRRWKGAATTRMEVLSPRDEEMTRTLSRPMKRTRSKLVMMYNEAGNE